MNQQRPLRGSLTISICALLLTFLPLPLQADVKLAGAFGDHMVLQQGMKLPVWGTAAANEAVTVSVDSADGKTLASANTTTDSSGKWRVDLPSLTASDSAVKMTVHGSNTIELSDILVGEVWICAGQSNMQYSLKGALNAPAAPNDPAMRLCMVGQTASADPITNHGMKWQACTPDVAKKFSAVGYFFARDLRAARKVPIGIVETAVAGTIAEAWTPADAFKTAPELSKHLDELNKAKASGDKITAGVPSSLYNGMVAPLVPMGIRGVIWYQGESNAGHYAEYRTLFPALITAWRNAWNQVNSAQGDFPFLFVQLPGFGRRVDDPAPASWTLMRESQEAALKLPQTGMAVSIDCVPARALLHPKNKAPVGERLALVARRLAYGESIEDSGPRYDSMTIDGNKITLHFTHSAGLKLAPAPEENAEPATTAPDQLKGFAIADEDHHFVWATAQINRDDTVTLWSDSIPNPLAVRYGWSENASVDLYNAANLPAILFRTDDWKVEVKPPTTAASQEAPPM